MLRALRSSRSGRGLLFAAALLAVTGSFGLHPEPASDSAVADFTGPAWTGSAVEAASGHGCTACLAHRNVSLSGLAVFAPTSGVALGAPVPVPARGLRLFLPRLDDGRAPPALL
jgi:hypothetical protein